MEHVARFHDRRHAGRVLAEALEGYRSHPALLVLGLPRGGLPVAFEVARALDALLDVFVVRKIGMPGHAEFAMGAVASGGVRVMNPLPGAAVAAQSLARVVGREEAELVRREQLYRGTRPAVSLAGRTVIVVDDGVATGATMQAALIALRAQRPLHLVAAVPVGSAPACDMLRARADDVVCMKTPEPFRAVSLWYENFEQTTDDEVGRLLEDARREHALQSSQRQRST